MSGVISVGAAVAATAFAASEVAAVGLTIGSAFAITAAVGATLGAVGTIAKVKELQYAGAALGAVGLIGSVASAAGLFGAASELGGAVGEAGGFGSWMGGAGDAVSSGGSTLGTDAATWANVTPAAIPTTGYAEAGAAAQGATGGGIDAIDMVNGIPQVSTAQVTPPLAEAPVVTPEVATDASTAGSRAWFDKEFPQDKLPGFESPTKGFDQWAGAGDAAQIPNASPVSGSVTDPAGTGLINQPIEGAPATDTFGNVISQGDATSGAQIGPGTTNPAARPGQPLNDVPVSGAPTPSGVAGTPGTPSPVSTTPTVTGTNQSPAWFDAGATQSASAASAPPEWAGSVASKAATAPNAPGWGDSILAFTKSNNLLMYGAIQTAGSFFSGAMSPLAPATVEELNSRAAQNKAAENLYNRQAELLQRRMENMSRMPVASRIPNGLMNSVTGRV